MKQIRTGCVLSVRQVAQIGDIPVQDYARLITVERPALLRLLEIAARRDYAEADAEYAILTAELADMDRRIGRLACDR